MNNQRLDVLLNTYIDIFGNSGLQEDFESDDMSSTEEKRSKLMLRLNMICDVFLKIKKMKERDFQYSDTTIFDI